MLSALINNKCRAAMENYKSKAPTLSRQRAQLFPGKNIPPCSTDRFNFVCKTFLQLFIRLNYRYSLEVSPLILVFSDLLQIF